MARDALDPGPEGNYPYWPRKPDGTPDEERMPTGETRRVRPRKNPMRENAAYLDLQPYDEDGNPIVPPTLP